ncbi:MAG TPA: hypothetical protein VGX48_11240 [Pyrinomonadaceae bacterium]|jgi:hypothetical protein|nr:hypothetical protein [Pyrinomonadaceae bacterium]
MIFLLAGALLLTAWQFTARARRRGLAWALRGVAVSACCGLLAGVFIGVGARVGMGAITVANGAPQRLTASGTFTVIIAFSSFGIALGVVYEGLLRRLLRRSGLAYGALLTLCTWYPLAHAAAQQLTAPPAPTALAASSGLFVGLMWLPFGLALEALLGRWHDRERRQEGGPFGTVRQWSS